MVKIYPPSEDTVRTIEDLISFGPNCWANPACKFILLQIVSEATASISWSSCTFFSKIGSWNACFRSSPQLKVVLRSDLDSDLESHELLRSRIKLACTAVHILSVLLYCCTVNMSAVPISWRSLTGSIKSSTTTLWFVQLQCTIIGLHNHECSVCTPVRLYWSIRYMRKSLCRQYTRVIRVGLSCERYHWCRYAKLQMVLQWAVQICKLFWHSRMGRTKSCY